MGVKYLSGINSDIARAVRFPGASESYSAFTCALLEFGPKRSDARTTLVPIHFAPISRHPRPIGPISRRFRKSPGLHPPITGGRPATMPASTSRDRCTGPGSLGRGRYLGGHQHQGDITFSSSRRSSYLDRCQRKGCGRSQERKAPHYQRIDGAHPRPTPPGDATPRSLRDG